MGPSLGILGGSWKGFGESWRLSEAMLEVLLKDLGSFGSSWAVLARLGCVWGVLWARLGASEGVLEASWGHLGASWEDLGKVLGSLARFLKLFWKHF